jgi:UDP-N-acetyl-D-galactosamine dehydrogenase
MDFKKKKIGIIGLGYVGLPLAVAFSEKYNVIGYDINQSRIDELLNSEDSTLEISKEKLHLALSGGEESKFLPTNIKNDIADCNFYIVTVPTPTDKYNRPVLTPLIRASETVGSVLKYGDTVVYESTVYPGVTEDECVPILEKISGLKLNKDFYVGYSPERINPGDKDHTVTKILKITSGSNELAAVQIDQIYKSVIVAGTYMAKSIKVAEAAKVIENSQRDINIAFVNELSKIFNLLNIDTNEVLEAASTKWNFLKFKPGLVGGHCIGVDPYYLAQKAQEVGYHPEIILAGRRTNDGMGKYVATEVIKSMMRKNISIINSKTLILGFTFKENCPDFRNTKVIDIYNELLTFEMNVDIFDPWVNIYDVQREFKINLFNDLNLINLNEYQSIILAVAHDDFKTLKISKSDKQVIYDVKGVLEKENVDGRL